MEDKKFLTKRELRDELFGILSMCNGFGDWGFVGGKRFKEMQTALPSQIAKKIMVLQDLIEDSVLEGTTISKDN